MVSLSSLPCWVTMLRVCICRGLIGPSRQFGRHALYNPEVFALIFGALLPIPIYLWVRRYPNSYLAPINIPVILSGVGQLPPAVGINFSSWFATGSSSNILFERGTFLGGANITMSPVLASTVERLYRSSLSSSVLLIPTVESTSLGGVMMSGRIVSDTLLKRESLV
jgi:hypothetical protein